MTTLCATLNTGQKLPLIGLGTWKSEPGEVKTAVMEAIQLGFRHIDCAYFYMNEKEVGEALQECFQKGLCQRADLFVTSKLWNNMHADAVAGIKLSLENLQLEYLDMFLIHWPIAHKKDVLWCETGDQYLSPAEQPITETWKGMEACVEAGLAKGIGVSNFSAKKLQILLDNGKIPPAINQVERHVYLAQPELVKFCQIHHIHVTGYSPLGSLDRKPEMKAQDEPKMLEDPVVNKIAAKHKISPAQVVLRWAIQSGTASAIPKSVTPSRLAENIAVAQSDFVDLDNEDLADLQTLDAHYRYVSGKFWELPGGPYTAESLWDEGYKP